MEFGLVIETDFFHHYNILLGIIKRNWSVI